MALEIVWTKRAETGYTKIIAYMSENTNVNIFEIPIPYQKSLPRD